MPTNLAIDDRLIGEAVRLGGHRTKKDAVNAALAEYVRRRKQQRILSLFGTIDYDPNYDYKRERTAKPR
ncbi:MAG: type II toxin-antitoxin system VapB family antitoxin [Bryobacteraceae bacterium]|nr:type II toxin-antitoxin system VapB family antitoxin [Bryobacteraceae bacterium]